MSATPTRVPRARSQDLVVQHVENEVIVLDRRQDKAHVLNPTAALVWKYCDGKRTVDQVAQLVAQELGGTAQPEMVWYTLAQLQEQDLVEQVAIPATARGMTRRDFITKFAVAAAVVPVIKTIQAPTPQQAGSCVECGTAAPAPCCPPNKCCLNICAPTCF